MGEGHRRQPPGASERAQLGLQRGREGNLIAFLSLASTYLGQDPEGCFQNATLRNQCLKTWFCLNIVWSLVGSLDRAAPESSPSQKPATGFPHRIWLHN